jgi:hypothetical protein
MENVLYQNYFTFRGNIYQPHKGVVMGSPIASTIAEIFLQHYENSIVKHLLESKIIIYYTRYVDDILIIYDHTVINPNYLTDDMN